MGRRQWFALMFSAPLAGCGGVTHELIAYGDGHLFGLTNNYGG